MPDMFLLVLGLVLIGAGLWPVIKLAFRSVAGPVSAAVICGAVALLLGHSWTSSGLSAAAGFLAVYVVVSWRWPRSDCFWCGGAGKLRDGTGANLRPCGHCGGSGHRARFATRIRERR